MATEIESVLFELEVRSGNQAIVDDHRGELARILREIADKVERGSQSAVVYDVNGNNVGFWEFDLDERDLDEDADEEE